MVKLPEPQVIRCVGASMPVRFKKPHAAFKHGAYSATAVLPGEDEDAFRELHQKIIAELAPVGALEEDLVGTIARLLWRKQNLAILRMVEFAREHGVELRAERPFFRMEDLQVEELDAIIDKCLKRLLFLRGVKSLSSAASSASPQPVPGPPRIPGPKKCCVSPFTFGLTNQLIR